MRERHSRNSCIARYSSLCSLTVQSGRRGSSEPLRTNNTRHSRGSWAERSTVIHMRIFHHDAATFTVIPQTYVLEHKYCKTRLLRILLKRNHKRENARGKCAASAKDIANVAWGKRLADIKAKKYQKHGILISMPRPLCKKVPLHACLVAWYIR